MWNFLRSLHLSMRFKSCKDRTTRICKFLVHKKRLVVVLSIVVIALILFGISWGYGMKTPVKQNELNPEYKKYARLALILNDFVASDKVLCLKAICFVSEAIQNAYAESGKTPEARLHLNAGVAQRSYLDFIHYQEPGETQTIVIYATPDVGEPLPINDISGKDFEAVTQSDRGGFYFPFDRYSIMVSVRMPLDGLGNGELEVKQTMPFAFYIEQGFGGYDLEIISHEDNSIVITIERMLFDRVKFVALMLSLFIATILTIILFLKKEMNALVVIGIVTLVVGIPSVRMAIVPSEIKQITMADVLLVLPFATLLLIIIATLRTVLRRT